MFGTETKLFISYLDLIESNWYQKTKTIALKIKSLKLITKNLS